jgi:hypothetical protein
MSQAGYDSIVSYANTEQELQPFLSSGRRGGGGGGRGNTHDVEIQNTNNDDDDISIPDSLDECQQQPPTPGLFQQMIAECIGTCMLVQIGCAGYCVSTYLSSSSSTDTDTGSLTQWSIAMFWFVAGVLAVSCTYSISGAHLNPAISVSFDKKKIEGNVELF